MPTWADIVHNTVLRGLVLAVLFLGASGVLSWVLADMSIKRQSRRRERVEAAADGLFRRVLAITRERDDTCIRAALRQAIADALETRTSLAESSLYITNEDGVASIERRAQEALATLNAAAEHKPTATELDEEANALSRQLDELLANHGRELGQLDDQYQRDLDRLNAAHDREVARLAEKLEHQRGQIAAILEQIAQEKASLNENAVSSGA